MFSDWELNPGSCSWYARTLPLSYIPSPHWLFIKDEYAFSSKSMKGLQSVSLLPVFYFFFWDSVKVNFQCDTELPHLTTGKPGNATLPRKFSHEFAKPGVFLWVPEQLQQTLILEIDRGRLWELWVASADKHHQWCQQSRFVFRQARASHGGISRRKQRKEKELLFIFKNCWAVRL